MCGIVGYSGKNPIHQSELKALLIMAQSRGNQSTGVATRTEIFKKAEEAKEFTKRDLPTDNLVLGHTRFGTVGSVCDRNAHPFKEGEIVGVHNGCISNYRQLWKKEKVDQKVDSEIIWTMINRYGLEDGVSQLSGSLALGWIQDEKLNLYRHTNPCYIGFKKDSLYFGSESSYLEFIECHDIQAIDLHTHYIINDGEIEHKEKLSKNPSYTTTRTTSHWSGTRRHTGPYEYQKKNNGDKSGIRRYFPPTKAPKEANYIYHDDNMVSYFWFDEKNPALLTIEPVIPEYDWGGIESGLITNDNFLGELKKFHKQVYNSSIFQNHLKQIKNTD